MSFVFGANSASTGYNLTRSLRFRSSATAYLDRTPATTTNQQIWTWSAWVKRGGLAAYGTLLNGYNSGGNQAGILFYSNDTLTFDVTIASLNYVLSTTQVFRDPSAWYHLVYAIDTTQATAANRVKLYINGTQVTAFSGTYPPQNSNLFVNSTNVQNIGRNAGGGNNFDGYLAEVNLVDGSQLTPSSFGSTNATTGVWQPAAYTGSYGTNGFYLPFTSIGSASTSSYSAGFNGTSQYLTYPNSSNFAFGTAAFTIEFFINGASNNDKFILGGRSAIGTMGITTGGFAGSTVGALRYFGSSTIVSTNVITDSSYHHCAIVRDGSSNVKLYVDGALVASGTDTTNYTTTSGTWYIGTNDTSPGSNLLSAALSNLRIVKGTAVYTAAFTPPSAPLTAVSGTSLLTLQSSTIIDNSGNSVSISNTGTVVTSVSYPFVGNVGADFSGNNNNWSTNNISLNAGVTYDSMTDVPTLTSATAANYCVMNPLDTSAVTTISNGNLYTYLSASGSAAIRATIASTSGKFYWEVTFGATGDTLMVGVCDASVSIGSALWSGANAWMYYSNNGNKYLAGTGTAYGATFTANDVIGVALDLGAGTLVFYKNNTSQGTATSSLAGKNLTATIQSAARALDVYVNFGQRPFTYTPPTGYVALNTYNLPTSTIVKGNTVMDATLWTGNGSTQTITNAAAFKPDLVWVKGRSSSSQDNLLVDSVRGISRRILSNTTAAEILESGFNITAFNSSGFTAVDNTNGGYNVNGSVGGTYSGAALYVGWQWQAGQGSTSSNTSGSITSTVSVNASAGFSVVTYTGTGANATVGHGLGVAPSMVIVKNRTNTSDWQGYHVSLGQNYTIKLNSTAAQENLSNYWYNGVTSSVFGINGSYSGINASATPYVAYCWTPIAGFSAFGSLTGNGSADGPMVYTGFQPKFVIIKRTDSTGNWTTFDSARDPYNAAGKLLYPNYSNAEETDATQKIDFLSNGFKIRGSNANQNASGGTYIYMAFATAPFKNSLGF